MIINLLFYYSKNFGRNHRTNHFVEGEFVGINTSNKEEVSYMSVSLISKEEFINSFGINVLEDKYKKTYFKLTLYYQINEGENVYIELKNLTAYGTPISYKDDFGNYITPKNRDNQSNEDSSDYYLNVNYKNNELEKAEVYLFRK